MAVDVVLQVREEFLKTDALILDAAGHGSTPRDMIALYEREDDDSCLVVGVHKETGEVTGIIIEEFKSETVYAIRSLRGRPLPWTFSLPELGVHEKPLDVVLEAAWNEYRDVPLIGD